jgi:hypothetical protein
VRHGFIKAPLGEARMSYLGCKNIQRKQEPEAEAKRRTNEKPNRRQGVRQRNSKARKPE